MGEAETDLFASALALGKGRRRRRAGRRGSSRSAAGDPQSAARHANHGDVAVTLALSAETEVRGNDPMREARIWLHLRDVYRDQGGMSSAPMQSIGRWR